MLLMRTGFFGTDGGMTPAEIQDDEALRRREFPVCERSAFLAHAGVCPIPRRVAEAMSRYAADCMVDDQEAVLPKGIVLDTRKLAARLLGCHAEEIALVGPTSLGLSMVAGGLDWQPGDNVVFYHDDYPSNAVPWMALGRRKRVELRPVKPRHLGAITVEDVALLVDARTRLVALASAHFISGHRLDLDAIGSLAHARGALFCVDGIQTVGALGTSLAEVDFLAADSHKWMLGPCAAGILYVRREAQEKLRSELLGSNNVVCPRYITPEKLGFPQHAGRYEAGSPNFPGVVALHATFGLILECGVANVEDAVLGHTRFLREELRKRGMELAGVSDEALSGITTFRRDGLDTHALHRRLGKAGVTASLRFTRDGREWIRFSPHFYNTRAELERALAAVDSGHAARGNGAA